jgi:hypothetical protein
MAGVTRVLSSGALSGSFNPAGWGRDIRKG